MTRHEFRHRKSGRRGVSFVELMIAIAVLGLVMVMATEALSSNRELDGQFNAEDELSEDAARISRTISSDLSMSGWHVPARQGPSALLQEPLPAADVDPAVAAVTVAANPPETYQARLLAAQNAANLVNRSSQAKWLEDRASRYWPFVYVPRAGTSPYELGTFNLADQGHPYLYRLSSYVLLPSQLPYLLPGSGSTALTPPLRSRESVTLSAATARGGSADDYERFDVSGDRTRYLASFYERSQELCFLKQIAAPWQAKPDLRSLPREGFPGTFDDWTHTDLATRTKLKVLYPSAWQNISADPTVKLYSSRTDWDLNADKKVNMATETPYGIPMYSGIVNTGTGSSGFSFTPQWQTISAPLYKPAVTGQPTTLANQDSLLRDYAYCVIPSPRGLGRLVRTYRIDTSTTSTRGPGVDIGCYLPAQGVGSSAMYIEEVLSDNVVRAVFDTYRTDNSLGFNQVRARLYLARRSVARPDMIYTRVVDQLFSMRARNSGTDRAADSKEFLGVVPPCAMPQFPY